MTKMLCIGILLYVLQCFIHADTNNAIADIMLSKENANLFLQTKKRNRRGLAEGLKEECCDETCWYEERNEYVKEYGWPTINEALCKLSNLDKKNCNCRTKARTLYKCGSLPNCKVKPCMCGSTPKEWGWWEVIGVNYNMKKGSITSNPVTVSSKTINNLGGSLDLTAMFNVSVSVTEEEEFSYTNGTSPQSGETFTVGIPVAMNSQFFPNPSMPALHTYGKRIVKKAIRGAYLPCAAPAHSKVQCYGMLKIVRMTVPYKMTIKHRHYGCSCTSIGIYESVHHSDIYLKRDVQTPAPPMDSFRRAFEENP